MILFWKNFAFLVFIITVTFTKAGIPSTPGQDNEPNKQNSGESVSTIESQPNQEEKTQKIDPSNDGGEIIAENLGKSTKDDPKVEETLIGEPEKFPATIIDYFTNPKLDDELRLDYPKSYYESNSLSKKSVFEFEKLLPFMVQREILEIKDKANFVENLLALNKGTTYFQASTLILEHLTMEDIRNTENKDKLVEFLRQKNITEDDFKLHEYYYFSFFSEEEKKRLIPTCPDTKETTIEFISKRILKEELEQLETVLEPQYVVKENAVFSSDEDEDEDTDSASASLKRRRSKKLSSPSSSPGRSKSRKSTSGDVEIPTESPILPSSPDATNTSTKLDQSEYSNPKEPMPINVETKTVFSGSSSPNAANVSSALYQPEYSKPEDSTIADGGIPAGSPGSSSNPSAKFVTAKGNQSPTRMESSPHRERNKRAGMLDFTPLHFLSNIISQPGENQEEIIIKNKFKGKLLKRRGKAIQEDKYNAFNAPCETELRPSYVRENSAKYADIYYFGYLVDFERRVHPLVVHLLDVNKNMLWFHIGHLLMDKETKETYCLFSYAPFYETVFLMNNIPVYTEYTVDNEDTIGNLDYYTRMYSKENQEKVFKSYKNYKKYFNPEESLILVQQELMDQKSVPIMTHKRAALNYMNISPMYKIIKDTSWNNVENVMLKVPFLTTSSTVMFITGTYGSLKINNSAEGVYLDNEGELNKKKRIKVPYAFYKIMHIEYASPRLGEFQHEFKKFFLSIVIVTHNDPFETKPEKICDKPIDCETVGWKKVEQKNPKLGFTYCCKWTKKFSEDMKIIPMYASLKTEYVLDLRTLWFIESTKASNKLEQFEIDIVKEFKAASRVRGEDDSIQES